MPGEVGFIGYPCPWVLHLPAIPEDPRKRGCPGPSGFPILPKLGKFRPRPGCPSATPTHPLAAHDIHRSDRRAGFSRKCAKKFRKPGNLPPRSRDYEVTRERGCCESQTALGGRCRHGSGCLPDHGRAGTGANRNAQRRTAHNRIDFRIFPDRTNADVGGNGNDIAGTSTEHARTKHAGTGIGTCHIATCHADGERCRSRRRRDSVSLRVDVR